MAKEIKTTKNYSMFKPLEGNREIRDRRVDKIVQSIVKIGYITSPILVNEKMEVIDGQGRLSALERLGLPVEYIVHEGIGIEECRQMNIHQSNWGDYDYVQSFAVRGSEDYQRLQSLIDQFRDLPISVVAQSAAQQDMTSVGGGKSNLIRSGNFKCTKQMYEKSKWELDYAAGFKQVARSIGGNKAPFYFAVIYAYRNLEIKQRQRLAEEIRIHALEIPSMGKTESFLKYFDEFYNFGQRKNGRIHLCLQWQTDQI